jgi:uncharacterized protein (TIGR02145 family)
LSYDYKYFKIKKMKTISQTLMISIVFYWTLCISCQKLDTVPITKFCTTPAVTDISYTSAVVKGNLMDIGDDITSYGHCWSTYLNPTIFCSKFEIYGAPTKQSEYSIELKGLNPGTKYFVRAYVKTKLEIIYGDEINFTTNLIPSGKLVDVDNNLYDTVKVGNQIWMKQNLKVTHFGDGTEIPLVTQNSAWTNLNGSGYCWSNNDGSLNKNTYGALYNWFAVITGKLCPTGWHMPTDPEWATLITYLGGLDIAGGKLKETGTIHWAAPNNGATNETGFTGLPGGIRGSDGVFYVLGQYGTWWTSTQFTATQARSIAIGYPDGRIFRDTVMSKNDGKSVRCVRD